MAWVIPINSYLVSGFTILFFNFFVFSAVKTLCQSICASQNLHVIYDKRMALEPRRSRFSSFFGGPTGPPRLARFFAVLIALFAILVIILDFAVNGDTQTKHVRTVYKSLVRAHPLRKPLHIDYADEFYIDPDGKRFASTRLIAVAEAHSCMELNITHHMMYAYAFREVNLDKTLVELKTFPKGGVCVTKDNFQNDLRMHIFKQVDEFAFKCNLTETTIELDEPQSGSVIVNATITPKNPRKCDLDFHAVQCFTPRGETTHCAIVATIRDREPNYMVIAITNHKLPEHYRTHQLREVDNILADDARGIAANLALFTAMRFGYGIFNAMYMTLSEVVHDVPLNRTVRRNVSEIDVAIAAPVLCIVILVTLVLAITAFVMWVKYVYRKNRRKYTTFSSVEEVLSMVRSDGLTKSKEGDNSNQVIFLHRDRPVLMQDVWFA